MSTPSRFASLLSKLIDDAVSEQELNELRDMVASDAQCRGDLVDQLLLDSLLEESLGREPLTALVDLISQSAGLENNPEPQPPRSGAAPQKDSLAGRHPRVSRWLVLAASLPFFLVLFWLSGEWGTFASASQIVEAAIRTHAALIERVYVVEVRRGAPAESSPLPRDVQVVTQGDRFWVRMRGFREWAWGRDEQGSIWITLGPKRAVILGPNEMGTSLANIADLYSLNLDTLLKNLLSHCRLERSKGAGDTNLVVATPKRTWPVGGFRQATVEFDRETKAIRRLEVNREFEGMNTTVTFTLVESRLADEARYRPEGHLTPPFQVYAGQADSKTRRQLMADWFGPRADRWMTSPGKATDEK